MKKTIDDYKEQANIKHNRKYDYSQIIELNKMVKRILEQRNIFLNY